MSQEKHLVKRLFWGSSHFRSQRRRSKFISFSFMAPLNDFYMQLTVFKKILNFLFGVFSVLAFEILGDITLRIWCTLIFRHFKNTFHCLQTKNGGINTWYKWRTYISNVLLFYAFQVWAVFPMSDSETVVRLKIKFDNMGSNVPMIFTVRYCILCLRFWKEKSDQEVKILVYSYLSIWFKLFLLFKIERAQYWFERHISNVFC